jgi:hypothetical protein
MMHQQTVAGSGFKMICESCGSLQIKLADPTKLDAEKNVRCGRCDAVRGTLDQLHSLARMSRDVFEI